MSTNTFVQDAKRLLERAAKKPAAERFAYWVHLGMIDRAGRLTKSYGGSAEAEKSSIEAAAAILEDPIDRLVWISRSGNNTLCLDTSTATRLLEGTVRGSNTPPLVGLTELLRDAMDQGLIERWSAPPPPASLNPEREQDVIVGIRLTEKGSARARKLEQQHDPALPLEALR